jgi:chemotaxis protein methyltransferase CheR
MEHSSSHSHPHHIINDQHFNLFSQLIQARIGFKFNESRRDALGRALLKGSKQANCHSLEQYYTLLEINPNKSELWEDLIKALTICETYFFRDPDQIDVLKHNIIPDLVARRWNQRTIRVWSAGCSTGEEPYTLAILLRQVIPDIERWKISILATDINKNALHSAVQARYRDWSFRQADDNLLKTYFAKEGSDYLLIPTIKNMVKFAYLNIAEDSYPNPENDTHQIDLILCRNVTIYLSESVIQQIAHRFYQCLSPGGWLMVSPSETNDQIYYQYQVMRYEKAIVYQKLNQAKNPENVWNPAPPVESKKKTESGFSPHTELVDRPKQNLPRPEPARPIASAHSKAEFRVSKPVPAMDIKTDSAELLKKCQDFVKQRQYEEARKCFSSYLGEHPEDFHARVQFAQMEANAGRKEEAQRLANEVIKKDPLNADAYFILAILQQENGEPDQALTTFKKVLYLSPNHILAHFYLSNLYHKKGLVKEASRHRSLSIQLAGQLKPDDILFGSDGLSSSDFLDMARP